MKNNFIQFIMRINRIVPLNIFVVLLFGSIILFASGKYHNSIVYFVLTIIYIILYLVIYYVKDKKKIKKIDKQY